METVLIYIFLFICGAAFASFIHVYVTRTINGESIIKPRSHCTNCGHVLAWYELIPVVSYIALKGKCRKCDVKIGTDALAVEIALGCLFMVVFARYGFSYESLIGFVISMVLISIMISDFKELIILDSTIVAGTVLYYMITFASLGLRGIYRSLLFGVFAFVIMFLIKILGDKLFRRESLGGGDIKLAFFMGSILPYNLFLSAIIVGSMCALPYAFYVSKSSGKRELAFGPFLVLGLLIVFLFKNDIINIIGSVVELERMFL